MQDKNDGIENNSENIPNDANEISHKRHDIIQNIEFNSADDVRQTMKAVFTNTIPNSEDNQQIVQNNFHPVTNHHRRGIEIRENNKCHINLPNKANTSQMVQTSELPLNKNKIISRKRPYKSSKAGPSKKQKKRSLSSIYLGKLSNVIRRYESDSDY